MKNNRILTIILSALISIPTAWLLYDFLNPPQCPLDYTQSQIDSSRCIVGANIGGNLLFIVLVSVLPLIIFSGVERVLTKKKK